MDPFRPTSSVVDTGIQDTSSDFSSSIRPTVSLFDDDDDEVELEVEVDDGNDDDVETDKSNLIMNFDSCDTSRRIPPLNPPPPPPSDDVPPENTVQSLQHIDDTNDEERIQQLRHRLLQIYQERRICRIRQLQCDSLLQKLQTTHNIRQQEQQRFVSDYLGCTDTNHPTSTGSNIAISQYWNVIASDAFLIVLEHGNTIASINGLRLGAMVTLTPPPPLTLRHSVTPNPNPTHQTTPSGTTTTITTTTTSTPIQPNGHIQSSPSPIQQQQQTSSPYPLAMAVTKYKIPWAEINAALGQVAVLITTMEQNLQYDYHSSMHQNDHNNSRNKHPTSSSLQSGLVLKHEFICMGSTSKIGVRKPTSSNTATGTTSNNINYYNLFYTEENTIFHMLLNTKKRNFDIALQLLLACVHDICNIVHDRDRTVYIPYEMNIKQWTIATLPITYFSGGPTNNHHENTTNIHEQAEQWTRAMKYVLSNLKHAMSYRGIGLWNVVTSKDISTITNDATVPGME